jgi:hypothetical protein
MFQLMDTILRLLIEPDVQYLSPVSLHCTGSTSSVHTTKPISLGRVNIISILHGCWRDQREFQINVHVDPVKS